MKKIVTRLQVTRLYELLPTQLFFRTGSLAVTLSKIGYDLKCLDLWNAKMKSDCC